MSIHRNVVAIAMVLVMSPVLVQAAKGRIDASQEGAFTKDRRSVIIAKVNRVWREKSNLPDDDRMQEKAVLAPLATIAGNLDPSLHPTISVEYYTGAATSSIKAIPKQEDVVLAVIRHQVLVHDDPTPRNVIESSGCTFMPDRSAVVTIKGPEDPAVRETLARIQEGRAKRAEIERKANAQRQADQNQPKK